VEGEAKITTDPFISIPDLVSRLRNYPWLTTAAANEIERLRKENDDLKEIVALQGEVVKLAQRRHEERDEARRRYCFAMAEHGEEAEARQNAEDEGWDCFDRPYRETTFNGDPPIE